MIGKQAVFSLTLGNQLPETGRTPDLKNTLGVLADCMANLALGGLVIGGNEIKNQVHTKLHMVVMGVVNCCHCHDEVSFFHSQLLSPTRGAVSRSLFHSLCLC